MEIVRLVWAVIGGFIDYLIGILHDISREYRSISKILAEEKESEKKRMRVRRTDQTSTQHIFRYFEILSILLRFSDSFGTTER